MTVTDERPPTGHTDQDDAGTGETEIAAFPLPLDVPAGVGDDDPWWDGELSLNDLLPLLQVNRGALDARRRRGRLVPPLTRRGYRYFTTRRTYMVWRHDLELVKAAELDVAARVKLVARHLQLAPDPVRVVVESQLSTVAALRAQAAALTTQADELERAAHAAIGA